MRHTICWLFFGSLVAGLGCARPAGPPPAPASARPMTSNDPAPAAGTSYADRTKQLHSAAEKGQVSRVLELLTQGANVNDKDDAGETALHKAASAGQKSAAVALLARGADPAERDAQGRTALLRAAEAGNADLVSMLLDPQRVMTMAGDVLAGVSADAAKSIAGEAGKLLSGRLYDSLSAVREGTDKEGQTALMKAAAGGHVDCVKELFKAHGPLNQRDRKGQSALLLAAAKGHAAVVDLLVDHPGGFGQQVRLSLADVIQTNADGKTAEQLAESAGHKAAVAAVRRGVLLNAARDGNLEVMKSALAKSPEFAERALLMAAEGGQTAIVQYLMGEWKDKPAAEKLRLMGGSQPDGPRSGTALHFAILADSPVTVRTLVDKTWWKDPAVLADYLNRRGFNGQTPLEWANFAGFGINAKPACAAEIRAALEAVKGK